MDFDFSESQRILINTARDFLGKEGNNLARKLEKTEEGHSAELWKKMADLGWMGLPFPEEYGGTGGGFLDLSLLLAEMGRYMIPGPFVIAMISGLTLLSFGSKKQKEEYLPKITSDGLIITLANSAGQPNGEDRLEKKNGGLELSGAKLFVPYAHVADQILYHCSSARDDLFFLVDTRSSGIRIKPLNTIASDRQYEVIFDKVEVTEENIVGQRGKGKEISSKIEEWGAIFHCAFILGLLEKVLELAVTHAKQREQFGKLIGSLQVIQHQCADMATEIDKVKFLTYQAAWKLDEGLPSPREIAMAKIRASEAARNVTLLGIKIHGGIGITEEHDMQLYFRMAKAAEMAFGDGDHQREIVARQLGL